MAGPAGHSVWRSRSLSTHSLYPAFFLLFSEVLQGVFFCIFRKQIISRIKEWHQFWYVTHQQCRAVPVIKVFRGIKHVRFVTSIFRKTWKYDIKNLQSAENRTCMWRQLYITEDYVLIEKRSQNRSKTWIRIEKWVRASARFFCVWWQAKCSACLIPRVFCPNPLIVTATIFSTFHSDISGLVQLFLS